MDYLVNATPQECLGRAEAHMFAQGYAVVSRGDTSITFGRTPGVGGGMKALMLGNALLNPKQFGQDLTALNTIRYTATLVAAPETEGETRLTVGGPTPVVRELLQEWVEGDLLGWSKELLMKLKGGKKELVIFEDRIEVYEGFSEPRKHQRIMLTRLEAVSAEQGRIYADLVVKVLGAESVVVGWLDQKKAQKAQELIRKCIARLPEESPLETPSDPASKLTSEDEPKVGDALDQIRRLAELRDDGIVSNEEFEAKKAELLRRL